MQLLVRSRNLKVSQDKLFAKFPDHCQQFTFTPLGFGWYVLDIPNEVVAELTGDASTKYIPWMLTGTGVWLEFFDTTNLNVGDLGYRDVHSEEQVVCGGGEKVDSWTYNSSEHDDGSLRYDVLKELSFRNWEIYTRGIFARDIYGYGSESHVNKAPETSKPITDETALESFITGRCYVCSCVGPVVHHWRTDVVNEGGRKRVSKEDCWLCNECSNVYGPLLDNLALE